jgi:hypothetical protein
MKRLIKNANGLKVFFVVDNLRVHHGKMVTNESLKNENEIESSFLPPYSPHQKSKANILAIV